MQDARRLGFSEEDIAALSVQLAGPDGECQGLWVEHADTVEAFLSVASQWRVTAIGGGMAPVRPYFVGLDYAGARAGLDAAELKLTPEQWLGLRIMEQAARDALNGVKE